MERKECSEVIEFIFRWLTEENCFLPLKDKENRRSISDPAPTVEIKCPKETLGRV